MKLYEKNQQTSYALGVTLVFELLKKKKKLARKLYFSPLFKEGESKEQLIHLAKEAHIPIIQNNQKIFSLSEKESCYAIGEFQKEEESLKEDCDHVLLVHPSNQGNLGTIMRAMASFSCYDLGIISPNADPFAPKTIRSSMGAFFSLRVKTYSSFELYQKEYPNHSFYPFMLNASSSLDKLSFAPLTTLIFGNEATGLPSSFLKVGKSIRIPMEESVDSLNLDNAASIALYTLYLQRKFK